MSFDLRVKKIGDGRLPDYHYTHDAGLDLYAAREVSIPPGARALVPTGIACAIPEGYVGLVWDKSGLSNKKGLKTLGGVIDAGYRGEIMIGLINLSNSQVLLPKHEPVAQMLVQQIEHVHVVEVENLEGTERGEKGFDSREK